MNLHDYPLKYLKTILNCVSGSLVCPPCENVCEGKPPTLTSSSKTLSGHGGVADRYVSYKVLMWE